MGTTKPRCYFCCKATEHPCTSWAEVLEVCKDTSAKTLARKESDPVNPTHYSKYEIEPIEFILKNKLPYAVGNVIKYILRYKDKNGLEDLEKARKYIDLIIEHEYGIK